MVKNNYPFSVPLAVLICGILSCTGVPFLVPNPPPSGKKVTKEKPQKSSPETQSAAVEKTALQQKPGEKETEDTIDFAVAFGANISSAAGGTRNASAELTEKAPVRVAVPGRMIRVALRQNLSRMALYSAENAEIHSCSLKNFFQCSGRCMIETKNGGRIAITVASGAFTEVALPCTLVSLHESNRLYVDQASYRGSMIIAGERLFSIINYVAVEDYLRGVLPLEMGRRAGEEVEALKAQAVVARTYAYKHIVDNCGETFDLLSTITDQVYGGADVETPETDSAVCLTADLVLTWHDSLAGVYYHSTCGGMTANSDEVWGKVHCDYLGSRSDMAPDGQAYCSFSPVFNWEESWDAGELSKILRTTVRQMLPGASFSGNLKAIKVDGRFGCGRVKSCRLLGTEGNVEYGGDKLRFLLRRKAASGEILRSANFTVVKNGPRTFTLRGRGYGHGVGMCQMGAIGRSRQGQSFEQILKAYFSGVELRPIRVMMVSR